MRGLKLIREWGMVLGLAVILIGCGSKLTSENLEKVKNGMKQEEVRALLGKPTREDTSSLLGLSGSTWIYQHGSSQVTVTFVNDGVIKKEGTFQE